MQFILFLLPLSVAGPLAAVLAIAALPFALAANLAADIGDAFDRRARVRGVDGQSCDAEHAEGVVLP